jgi:hypothetical protein
MDKQKACHRCGTFILDSHFWMGKHWCADCFERQTGLSADPDMLPQCALCGEEMLTTTQHVLQDEPVCLHCLLHVGPERAQLLVKIKKLDTAEVATAVMFLRKLLNRNQTLRLRDAIENGGRNWWVKLPEFGEYVCRFLVEQGINWDNEVLDEVWDSLVEEAVEEMSNE